MSKRESMPGKVRRKYIIELLKGSDNPLTGQMLADETGVSRQVIVTDIALLRTSEEPILATSRGYIYQGESPSNHLYKKVIVCKHAPEDTKQELEIIVDCGVTVVDVSVEHPIYGELTGSLMISSRYDVNEFVSKLNKAAPLSILTEGVHLHTLESDTQDKIEAACNKLEEAGILITE